MSETVFNCKAYKCTMTQVMGFKHNHFVFNFVVFCGKCTSSLSKQDYACRPTSVFCLILRFFILFFVWMAVSQRGLICSDENLTSMQNVLHDCSCWWLDSIKGYNHRFFTSSSCCTLYRQVFTVADLANLGPKQKICMGPPSGGPCIKHLGLQWCPRLTNPPLNAIIMTPQL